MNIFKTFGSSKPQAFLAAVALGFAALTSSASAEIKTDTYSASFGPKITNFTQGDTIELILPKFDLTLGTLVSITFEFSGQLSATFNLTNTNPDSPETWMLTSTGTLKLINNQTETPVAFATLAPSNGEEVTYAGGESKVTFGSASADTTSSYFANGTKEYGNGAATINVADFTSNGAGNVSLYVSGQSFSSVGGTNWEGAPVVSGSGTAKVSYTYEAIPEPGTWAALAMGAGVLAFSARFRRRAA